MSLFRAGRWRMILGLAMVCWAFPFSVWALDVVVSIKPLHSLAAKVMEGVGVPRVLIHGGASPHTYTLRPSEARMLAHAEVIFWGGVGLETFLARSLENLAGQANKVALLDLPGLTLLPMRQGGAWEEEQHEDDAHEADAHQADTHQADTHKESHAHGPVDPHVWLNPQNAKIIGLAMARILGQADPGHAQQYQGNATALVQRLDELDAQLKQELAGVKDRHYIVFHDAYQYFENRYALGTVGSVVVHPDRAPGLRRIQEIGKQIRDTGAVCLFTEPQFPHRLAVSVADSTHVRIGTLDPLGATLPDGPDHYFQLMRHLARSLVDCLKP